MFTITIIFSCLFLQEINGLFYPWIYPGDVEPTTGWNEKYKEAFKDYANFSLTAAHIIHSLTVEDAWTSLKIKMPIDNGIPSGNPDLSADESDAVLAHVPSRPNEYSSPGMHGFVDFMDHVNDPDWEGRGSKLLRLFHVFHMQEMWGKARRAADNFSGVSDYICTGALDHANNGIEKALTAIFKSFKNENVLTAVSATLTWDDKGESWTEWKAAQKAHPVSVKSMGLYTQCLLRKFWDAEKPIELDGCCISKTVGEYTYTLVSAGKVLSLCHNNCIYTRKELPGSQYCFAKGDQKVQCLG